MKSSPRISSLLISSLLKGFALGIICCAFFVARGNVEALFNAASRPLSGDPWSVEDVKAEMAKGKPAEDVLSQMSSPEVGTTVALIIATCLVFGLWEGKRLLKIRRLENAVFKKSRRILKANARLKELSVRDPLTGLANRRLLFERLKKEQMRALRYDTPLSCMMVDIDYFKSINDSFGHRFGDFVLEKVADIIAEECREVDTVARYGGEEFAVILPSTTPQDAEALAERIRSAIAEHKFSHNGISTRLTVTFGITGRDAKDGSDAERLLCRADAAMYEGKRSGRNAVVVWSDNLSVRAKKERNVGRYMDEDRVQDLREKLAELSADLQQTSVAAVHSLLSAVKIRDGYTLKHSYDVAYYARAIAQHMGLSDSTVETVANAADLHDIGKICISESILTKPGKLSSKEFAAMKSHPSIAAQILGPLRFLSKEIPMIVNHHERYDGRGYPNGVAEEDIPLGARIIAVADAFSAMTTERPYKKSRPVINALQEMVNQAGKQFDPKVVRCFLEAIQAGKIALPAGGPGRITLRNTG